VTFGHCEAQTGRASPFPSWATERKERDDRARVPGPVSATAPETQGPCSGPPVAKSLVYGPGPGSSWGDWASSPTRFNTYSRGSTHLGAAQDLAGTLPCPARPCWPPSQPVSPSPVFAGPGPVVCLWHDNSVDELKCRIVVSDGRSEFIYKIGTIKNPKPKCIPKKLNEDH
jgi:hypothetical protein